MDTSVFEKIQAVVGPEYLSDAAEERYLYSMDPGTMEAAAPDAVALPETVEQISRILAIATEHKVPVIPMGGGLVLSGLTRALRGGLILDLKRMNRILSVSPLSRTYVVEAGTSQGMLQKYLKKHHPELKHSIPDAPPIATVGGNMCIHGSGHLSCLAGFHSDMLTGMEVVLPTGEVVRTGSCSVSPHWFGRAPLPDLSGLFLGWAGTTGVVTKVGLKLYPRYPLEDLLIFVTGSARDMPDILSRLTSVQVAEDMTPWMSPKPAWAKGFVHTNISFGARTKKELRAKRDLLRASVEPYIKEGSAGFLPLPPAQKGRFLQTPGKDLVRFADVKKGGGFEYVGAIMPIECFAPAYEKGLEIAAQTGAAYSMGARIIGPGHAMMFFYAYAFNRADAADVARAQTALEKTNEAALDMGGIPWKAEVPAQKMIIERMDDASYRLLKDIRAALDPSGIMNPGNW